MDGMGWMVVVEGERENGSVRGQKLKLTPLNVIIQ